jgi:hypothetical protein
MITNEKGGLVDFEQIRIFNTQNIIELKEIIEPFLRISIKRPKSM